MSDEQAHPDSVPPEVPNIPPAPAEFMALEHVVDDLEPRLEVAEWARAELAKGRTPEELTGELLANGWDGDDAAGLVEEARRQTRKLRGVVTRDEVARVAAAHYRQGMGLRWFAGFPTLSVAWRLMTSLTYLFGRERKK